MSTTFTRTATQLSDMILRKLGILGSGTSVSAAASDRTIITEAIDMWLKQAHREGIFWRKVTPRATEFTISPNIASASSVAGDMLYPIKMFARVNSRDEPVDIISYREYAGIRNKGETGTPIKALWTGTTSGEFIFWPIPTVTISAGVVYQQIALDTSSVSAIDVDVAMIPFVRDIIAYNLGDEYEVPEGKMSRWAVAAKYAENQIRKLNAPHVTLTPVPVDDFDGKTPPPRGYDA